MIDDQVNAWWWFKLNGLVRRAMAQNWPGFGQRYLVLTEYPKSGGTWMCEMLSEYLGVPYPRNRLPPWRRCILHGVYREVGSRNDTIVVWRDGRDVMVSYYFHIFSDRPENAHWQAEEVRRKLGVEDPSDVETYLPRFIDYCFTEAYPGHSWVDFIQHWRERDGWVGTTYERMSADTESELRKIVESMTGEPADEGRIEQCVEKYSFEAQTGRSKGEEDEGSFRRKGVVGDWRNKFTREAREVFDHYAGDLLVELGYEEDRSWVREG